MDGDDLEDADEDDDDDNEGAAGQFKYQVKCDPQRLNTQFFSTVPSILLIEMSSSRPFTGVHTNST